MKSFARTISDEHRHRERFRTSQAERFTSTEDVRSSNAKRSPRGATKIAGQNNRKSA